MTKLRNETAGYSCHQLCRGPAPPTYPWQKADDKVGTTPHRVLYINNMKKETLKKRDIFQCHIRYFIVKGLYTNVSPTGATWALGRGVLDVT